MSDELSLLVPDWPAPPQVHACVTTRVGGCSSAPYATNNLALHVGDNSGDVARNRQQLSAQLKLSIAPQWLEQVHGVKIVTARADGLVRTADGSSTRQPGLACAVMTADCLPILLCDIHGTQVAAVHAGWRGLAKGVLERALKQFSVPGSQLMAYLGPAISQPHFEVGIEVLEAFFKSARTQMHSEQTAEAFKPGLRPMHFYCDIYALAKAELRALGVQGIYGGNFCTFAEPERFYSYRRDKTTGRMASLIWISPDQ
jgi:YfiH family protein